MIPSSPVLTEEFRDLETIYAKDQKEYTPLPVIKNASGVVLSRWKLTDSERQAIAEGADVFLSVWTFNHPLQPLRIEIGECDRDLMSIATHMGLV